METERLQGLWTLETPAGIGFNLRSISATGLRSKSKEAGKHKRLWGLPALITPRQDRQGDQWRSAKRVVHLDHRLLQEGVLKLFISLAR